MTPHSSWVEPQERSQTGRRPVRARWLPSGRHLNPAMAQVERDRDSAPASSCIKHRRTLHARVRLVRPFELNGVSADGLGLPRTDVANFAVVIVVPALPWNRIRD